MKIVNLARKETQQGLMSGVSEEQIDKNERYEVNILYVSQGSEFTVEKNYLRSYYVLDGSVSVKMQGPDNKALGTKTFTSGQGWLLLPPQSQSIKAIEESKIFAISSSFSLSDIDITNRAKKVFFKADAFNELSDYTVNKPWGSEKWFVDTGIFVFKGIRMNSGFECSLQLHEYKVEVNLLLSGMARLILGRSSEVDEAIAKHYKKGGTQVDFSMPSEKIDAIKNAIKPTFVSPGAGWKAKPFEIHQVLSLDTYFALEVSTPEVDDIIRLKDLYNRPGGRINSEHKK
jgi:hypothetical protein